MLITGFVIFSLVYLGFAFATDAWMVWPLFLVYGAYIAFTEGVGKAFVTDLVPEERRGSAMGLYNASNIRAAAARQHHRRRALGVHRPKRDIYRRCRISGRCRGTVLGLAHVDEGLEEPRDMMNVLLVALGSALGGLSRYYVGIWVTNLSGARTLGTVLINVAGSFAIGLFLTLSSERGWNNTLVLFVAVGFLGGFTTFSTFAWNTAAGAGR